MTTKRPRPKPRAHLKMFRDLPSPIAHVSSIEGAKSAWGEVRDLVVRTGVTKDLPNFVVDIVQMFFDEDSTRAIRAMRRGDCAFFLAWQIRLDQIDHAIVHRGGTLSVRTPIIRAKYMLQGFLDAAKERLVSRGGAWPPPVTPATSDAEGRPAEDVRRATPGR